MSDSRWTDVMIDIETFGINTDTVILQIGTVLFNESTREVGPHQLLNVDWKVQSKRKIYHATLGFWIDQKKDVFQKVVCAPDQKPLPQCLDELHAFLEQNGCLSAKYWANSPTFDFEILKHAWANEGCQSKFPIGHRNQLDVRTIRNYLPEETTNRIRGKFAENAHEALNDCYHQIESVFAFKDLLDGRNTSVS